MKSSSLHRLWALALILIGIASMVIIGSEWIVPIGMNMLDYFLLFENMIFVV